MSNGCLFAQPPTIDFRPEVDVCGEDGTQLRVLKTQCRQVKSMAIGPLRARHTIYSCPRCHRIYGSEALDKLVPSASNFAYDVLVYVGRALFLEDRSNQEIIGELAQKNLSISSSQIDYLGKKFVAYLALAHWQRLPQLRQAMALNGGYVLHIDGTWEGRGPLLLSGLDSILQIVLDNAKVGGENAEEIIPFLEKIKAAYGAPVAVVKDMGAGFNKAVAQVFAGIPDFICHFHFLRDLGKDLLEADYELIRKRLRHHGITTKLRSRLKRFKGMIDGHPGLTERFPQGIDQHQWSQNDLPAIPLINSYSLILWILEGKTHGRGYGFPFDRPHVCFAQRLRIAAIDLDKLKEMHLRGTWQDNKPYYALLRDLKGILADWRLRKALSDIEEKIQVFDQLREAMRLAPADGQEGLNESGADLPMATIKARVEDFCRRLKNHPRYGQEAGYQKLIAQIERYRTKLFADPITVRTTGGQVTIQPQRTNNLAERFFRDLRRGYRRKRGTQRLGKTLQSMMADTPLVKNLRQADYRKLLLQDHNNLEELFAEIEIKQVRQKLAENASNPEKIPAKIKKIIAFPQLPKILHQIVQNHISA